MKHIANFEKCFYLFYHFNSSVKLYTLLHFIEYMYKNFGRFPHNFCYIFKVLIDNEKYSVFVFICRHYIVRGPEKSPYEGKNKYITCR